MGSCPSNLPFIENLNGKPWAWDVHNIFDHWNAALSVVLHNPQHYYIFWSAQLVLSGVNCQQMQYLT